MDALRKSFILIVFCFISSNVYPANFYVDGGTVESDATWSGIDGESYTSTHPNFPGAGVGYSTITSAVANISGGDDVYIRSGTYNEHDIYIDESGSADNYTVITSFPTEWSVVDGDRSCTSTNARGVFIVAGSQGYIKFDQLEIMGGGFTGVGGVGFDKPGGIVAWNDVHHITVRACYLHDNLEEFDNQGWDGAITTGEGCNNWLIEFNYLYNNGSESGRDTHTSQISILSDYDSSCRSTSCPLDLTTSRNSNIIRYNYFYDPNQYANMAIYMKAQQFLTPGVGLTDSPSDPTWANKEYGDKIHHNVIDGTGWVIRYESDYGQFNNNIVYNISGASDGSNGALIPPTYTTCMTALSVYNNTFKGGRLQGNWFGNTTPFPHLYWINNIFDTPNNTNDVRVMDLGYSIGSGYSSNFNRINIQNNYIYRDSTGYDPIRLTNDSDSCEGLLSLSEYDTCSGDTNYAKASSEGSDNIYIGTTGADAITTRGAHVVSGVLTVADAGLGGNHPYLDNTTIPSYVGATNPNDNTWVDGVIGLASVSTLQNFPDGDPSWVEGTAPATNPTNVISTTDNQSVSNPSFTIQGTATATTGRTIIGVTIPGETVTPDDGVWDEQVEEWTSNVTLPEGLNSYTATASDGTETGQDSINVTYTPTPTTISTNSSSSAGCMIR